MFLDGKGQEFLAKAEHTVASSGADSPENLSQALSLFEVVGVVSLDELAGQFEKKTEVDRKDADVLASAKDYADAHLEAAKEYADSLKSSGLDQASSAAEGIAAALDRALSGELVNHFMDRQPGLEILKKVYSSDEEMSNETGTTQFHSLKGWSYVISGASGNDLYVTLAEGSKPMLIGPETASGLIQKYATKDEVHDEIAAQAAELRADASAKVAANRLNLSTKVYGVSNIRKGSERAGGMSSGYIYRAQKPDRSEADFYLCFDTITNETLTTEYRDYIPPSALMLIGGSTKQEFRELSAQVQDKADLDAVNSRLESFATKAEMQAADTQIRTDVAQAQAQALASYATTSYAESLESSLRFSSLNTGASFFPGTTQRNLDALTVSDVNYAAPGTGDPGQHSPNVIICNGAAYSGNDFQPVYIQPLVASTAREVEVWLGYQHTGSNLNSKKPADAITANGAEIVLDTSAFSGRSFSVTTNQYVYYKFNVKLFGNIQSWTLVGVLVRDAKVNVPRAQA